MKPEIPWKEAQRICDLPTVDEYIRTLLTDQTNDNAVCMVREILEQGQCATSSKEASKTDCKNFPLCGCKTPCDVPEEASDAAQYPIGTIEVKGGECVKAWYDAALPDGFHKIYAAQAGQPVQEPVAWMRVTDITELVDAEPESNGWTPLYATPAQPCRDDVRFAAVKECHRLHKEEGKDYYTVSFVAGWEAALRTKPAQQAATAEPGVPAQAVTEDMLNDAWLKEFGYGQQSCSKDAAFKLARRLLSGSAKTGEAE